MGKIIDRYIIREVSFPFLLSLFIMTFVLLLGKILQLMDLMVNKGVNIKDIIKLIVLLMPYFLLYTLPISLLIAILVGLGRMASDNEITVLKGAGISLYRLFIPIAVTSFAIFLLALSLSLFFVPQSNHATKNLLFTILRYNASAGIKEKVFNDTFIGLLLYANNIPANGKYMEGVIISDNRITKEPNTIFAEKASLISDPDALWVILRLTNGSIHTMDLKHKYYRTMDFSSYDIKLDMEAKATNANRKRSKDSIEMTPGELIEKIRAPELEDEAKRELTLEFNKKFTFPLTCLIFSILGMPISITVRRSARARGITLSFVIVLLYYLLQLCGEGLTETGRISPWIGAWFPPVLFAATGIYLLVIGAKEKNSN